MAFHHDDHLSGANVTTSVKGEVLELADYYPYGEVRIEEKADGYQNDYLYTGQERDEETNLMYYGARYYDAKVGRFMGVDEWDGDVKDPQSLNKFSYARNNPLKYVDSTGHWFFVPAIIGAVAAIIVDAATIAYGARNIIKTSVSMPKREVKPTVIDVTPPTPKPVPNITPLKPPPGPLEVLNPNPQINPIPACQPPPIQNTPSVPHDPPIANSPSVPKADINEIPYPTWIGDGIASFSKRLGKERIRDSGLRDVSDEDVRRHARDKKLSGKERLRYIREEKARRARNQQKREN